MISGFKKKILGTSLFLSLGFFANSQNIKTIINQMHQEDSITYSYTLPELINEALQNNISIKQRLRNIKKDTFYYEIEKNNRRLPKINGNINIGYNIKEGLTNKNSPIYPEFNITTAVPILNTDNKYVLQLRKNNIKKDQISLMYDISNVIRNTSFNYLNILNLDEHIKLYLEEEKLIDSLLNLKTNNYKKQIIKNDLENLLNEVKEKRITTEELRSSEINSLTAKLGKITQAKITLKDKLKIPNKDLFIKPNYNKEKINKYLDTLCACSIIIRTQIERTNKENASINYLKKTNLKVNVYSSINFRNTVVPTPYFGVPFNTGISFNIFGNNNKQEKQIAELNILNEEDNINKVIIDIIPKVKTAYNKMILSSNLATLKNKNLYQKQLNQLINIYSNNNDIKSGEEVQLAKLKRIIESAYDTQRKYFDNLTIANKEAINVKYYVLFQNNPLEFARELEKNMINYDFSNHFTKHQTKKEILKK